MRHHHTGSKPHVQGSAQPLRVRHSARNLTDGGGLVLVRKLFDRMGLGGWIDCRTGKERGFFRPSLMVEVWVVLLLYGGGVMDDLPLLERRGVRRIFGWVRVPDPTTFGRWLRRVAGRMVPLLDALLWYMVRRRWALSGGAPERLTLVVDSTVVVRYGRRQAGAEVGYNPKKRDRPSRYWLLAFVRETGDCLGVRWRGGSAHTAEGAEEWIEELAQLSAGRTAVDDRGGNALLWGLAVVAYQTLHTLRENHLSGSWRTAQPKRLRLWLFRLPAKLTAHSRKVLPSFWWAAGHSGRVSA